MSCPRDLHSLSELLLYKVYVRYYIKYYKTLFWLRYCLSSCSWHKTDIRNIVCTLIQHTAEVFTSDIIKFVLPGDSIAQLLCPLPWLTSLFTGEPNPKISKIPSEVRGLWIKSVSSFALLPPGWNRLGNLIGFKSASFLKRMALT